MRLQILELPRKTVDDDIPFAVVISEAGDEIANIARSGNLGGLAAEVGARGVLAFDAAVDIGPGEPLAEWSCPNCNASTRARMADAEPVMPDIRDAAKVVLDTFDLDEDRVAPEWLINLATTGDKDDDGVRFLLPEPGLFQTHPGAAFIAPVGTDAPGPGWQDIGYVTDPGDFVAASDAYMQRLLDELVVAGDQHLMRPRFVHFAVDPAGEVVERMEEIRTSPKLASLDELAEFFGIQVPEFHEATDSIVEMGDTLVSKLTDLVHEAERAFGKKEDR